MTTRLEEVMIALETSIDIVVIQTCIAMDIGMAHARIWIDMASGIAMMTEAADTMIEAMIPRWAVAEEHLAVGPCQRPKLNLEPQSIPEEDDSSASTTLSSQAASIFGGAKSIHTAAREREVNKWLQKE
ncbi:Eukaryotic translation initiation factor 4B [Plecturocebus cupreus]